MSSAKSGDPLVFTAAWSGYTSELAVHTLHAPAVPTLIVCVHSDRHISGHNGAQVPGVPQLVQSSEVFHSVVSCRRAWLMVLPCSLLATLTRANESWTDYTYFIIYHSNNIRWALQIMKPLILQSSPLPLYYLVPLRHKYLPQHPVLEHPQPMFLPQCDRPSSTAMQNNRQLYGSVYFSIYVFG